MSLLLTYLIFGCLFCLMYHYGVSDAVGSSAAVVRTGRSRGIAVTSPGTSRLLGFTPNVEGSRSRPEREGMRLSYLNMFAKLCCIQSETYYDFFL